jgi:hypothetical protein
VFFHQIINTADITYVPCPVLFNVLSRFILIEASSFFYSKTTTTTKIYEEMSAKTCVRCGGGRPNNTENGEEMSNMFFTHVQQFCGFHFEAKERAFKTSISHAASSHMR